ncbi:HupE/UreJ family protein [Primorskyibacter sp. S87]|uniref:HupE/UreJ family protein n=1 Tax=Primorskyibacter sp. S87 TaxID=3415126 RepID=UPI003C7B2C05
MRSRGEAWPYRLRRVRMWLSLAVAGLWLATTCAFGHEVTPTIADFRAVDDRLQLTLRLNAEAFLAGVDFEQVTDTNASDVASDYDALRDLEPSAIEPEMRVFLEDWLPLMVVRTTEPVPLMVEAIRIGPVGNTDLPRTTEISLTGPLAGSPSLTLTWPENSGGLVLRQLGVEEPYAGYLRSGEATPRIALAGGAARTLQDNLERYLPIGFEHVLPRGSLHILFMLSLFFLNRRVWPLVWQIGAVVTGHFAAIALYINGQADFSPELAKMLLTGALFVVALENVFTNRVHVWRIAVLIGFGVVHGLSFANELSGAGLPREQVVPSMLGYNLGVDFGHLAVIAIALLTIGLGLWRKPWYRGRLAIPLSLAFALIALYWLVSGPIG